MAPLTEPSSRALTAVASLHPPPNAVSQPALPQPPSRSTSPPTDVDMAADAAPSKRAANAAEKPPLQKRARRLTWYDSVREAWSLLMSQFPQRQQFKLSEIVETVSNQWSSFRGKEKKNSRWKKEITLCIRSDTILTRSSDTTDEYYVLQDLNYIPRPNGKKNQPTKKKELSDDDAKLPDEQLSRATIPSEWTVEAFKPVRISSFDKSPSIQFIGDPSENTVKGYKGFRMARSTSGVCEGDWFFEAKVLPYEGDGAVRLGWSQRRSDPETPVGFDMYGYGYRDRTGGFVHAARVRPYSEKYGVNDVIGCRIQLPNLSYEQKQRIKESDEKWLHHRFINLLQGQPPPDCDIDIHGQAFVQFYKNGHKLGIPAFFTGKEPTDSRSSKKLGAEKRPNEHLSKKSSAGAKRRLCAGYFYPSISLYGNAIVQANFGPKFWFSLPDGSTAMSEAAKDAPPPEPAKNNTDSTQEQEKGPIFDENKRQDVNEKKSEDVANVNGDSASRSLMVAANEAQHDENHGANREEQSGVDEDDCYKGQSNEQSGDGNRPDKVPALTHDGDGVTDSEHRDGGSDAIGNAREVPIDTVGKGSGSGSCVSQDECQPRTQAASQSNRDVDLSAETTGESKATSSTKGTISHIVNP